MLVPRHRRGILPSFGVDRRGLITRAAVAALLPCSETKDGRECRFRRVARKREHTAVAETSAAFTRKNGEGGVCYRSLQGT